MPPTSVAKTAFTVKELDQFKKTARPGETAIYHRGFLYSDRLYDGVVENVAESAMAFEEAGYLYLFQRRLGDMEYEYIAMRTIRGTEQSSAPSLALAA